MRQVACAVAVLISSTLLSFAQEEQIAGWKSSTLPLMGYDSKLGVLFGASSDLMYYGEQPSLFPDYYHRLHFELSVYTEGQAQSTIEYEGHNLIDGIKLYSALNLQLSPLAGFYGYNGSPYDKELDKKGSTAYYSMKRDHFSFLTMLQGQFSERLQWLGGLAFKHYDNGDLVSRKYDSNNSLFSDYRASGLILDNELRGTFLELKAGLLWDSRDSKTNPRHGIKAELLTAAATDFSQGSYSYIKLRADYSQFFDLGLPWLTLAYHLCYQGCLAGSAPFYIHQELISSQFEPDFTLGLGGYNNLRGLFRGRLLGEDYAWANFELRLRLFTWEISGMKVILDSNPFFDLGLITRPFRLERMASALGTKPEVLKGQACQVHKSAGLGLKLGLAEAYILSIEGALPLDRNDGPFILSISTSYIF